MSPVRLSNISGGDSLEQVLEDPSVTPEEYALFLAVSRVASREQEQEGSP